MTIFQSSRKQSSQYFDLVAFICAKNNDRAKSILRSYDNLRELKEHSTGKSLLHKSAECGNAAITRVLIECGCEVNAQDNSGQTALMLVPTIAASCARLLLDANACMHMTDFAGCSGLAKLIKNCRAEWSSLQSNAAILQVFHEKLQRECSGSRQAIARKLLDAQCPLPMVVLLNDSQLTRCMLQLGCALHESAHGLSALHVAVQTGDPRNARLLLQWGAQVDAADRAQETPLCKYSTDAPDSLQRCELLKLLLQAGASLSATALKEHAQQQREPIARRLLARGQRATVLTLLRNGALQHSYGPGGQAALHYLAQNPNGLAQEAMPLAISRGARLEARDSKGRSALTLAVAKGLTGNVQCLLALGARATVVDVLQKTPMIRHLSKLQSQAEYQADRWLQHYARVFRLLLGYAIDFQSLPDGQNMQCAKSAMLLKLALAYLAIAQQDGASICSSTLSFIMRRQQLRQHYQCCIKQLQLMQPMIVHGSVTAHKLLTDSEDKLVNYACNAALLADFGHFLESGLVSRHSYYHFILQRRVCRATRLAKLRQRAAAAICRITGLPANEHRHIVDSIVAYLNNRDFAALFQASKLA